MQIELNQMPFYAYHGVLEQERCVGNHFCVSINAEVDAMRSTYTDALEDTISYADLYASVQDEMSQPSQLLEHVAGRIARRLFADFPRITRLRIQLTKHNPPILGEVPSASVILEVTPQDLRLC